VCVRDKRGMYCLTGLYWHCRRRVARGKILLQLDWCTQRSRLEAHSHIRDWTPSVLSRMWPFHETSSSNWKHPNHLEQNHVAQAPSPFTQRAVRRMRCCVGPLPWRGTFKIVHGRNTVRYVGVNQTRARSVIENAFQNVSNTTV